MTNKKVVELDKIDDIRCEVRQRRLNWLGHILRREGEIDCFTALGWTPEGGRAREDHKLILQKRGKQSWVEELGSRRSSCKRQKVLVRQCGWLMRLVVR